MTTKNKVARRKLSLLELAKELDNVSRACKVMGYSRQQFYEIRRNFQTYGAEGLIDRLPGPRGPHPNRVAAQIEAAILEHALQHPCHGALRVEQELRLQGIQVSSGGVRGVWQRHGLLTRHERLLRLEKTTAERRIELSDEQVRLLERFSPEVPRTPYRSTPYRLPGGRRYLLRRHPQGCGQGLPADRDRLPFAPCLGALVPEQAAGDRRAPDEQHVLPTFEAAGVRIEVVLSDNGREFCGRPDRHPYELFLQLEEIEHRTTKVKRPHSNGIVERLHRTLLDEHFRVEGRRTWFETIEEMQTVLDDYMTVYNRKRPHQGRGMNGRTPGQAFKDGLPATNKPSTIKQKENPEAA